MTTGYEIVTVTEDFPAEDASRGLRFKVTAPSGKRVVNSDVHSTSFTPDIETPVQA